VKTDPFHVPAGSMNRNPENAPKSQLDDKGQSTIVVNAGCRIIRLGKSPGEREEQRDQNSLAAQQTRLGSGTLAVALKSLVMFLKRATKRTLSPGLATATFGLKAGSCKG